MINACCFRPCENPVFQTLEFCSTSASKSHTKVIPKSCNSQRLSHAGVDRFALDSCMTLHDLCLTNVKFLFLLRVTRIRTHRYLGAKCHTQIHEDSFPRITQIRESKTCGSMSTHRYLQWRIFMGTHRYTHGYPHQEVKESIYIL